MIDGGDAEFHAFQVLIGEIDVLQGLLKQFGLLFRRAVAGIGETLARLIGVGKFVFVAES